MDGNCYYINAKEVFIKMTKYQILYEVALFLLAIALMVLLSHFAFERSKYVDVIKKQTIEVGR